jgi:cobalt transporter subunit CbtA
VVFRRIIYSALLVGFFAGLILTAAQITVVNPVIFAAEAFEIADSEGGHDHGAHSHSEEAWAPEDGRERTAYTLLSSISGAIGFAVILLALMSQFQLQGLTNVRPGNGVLWGVVGFITFFVAPGIGLPPEIPGVEAAAVEFRQLWWAFTVIAVGIGIGILVFGLPKYKLVGLVSVAMPYIVGAPHISGPEFSHPDPAAVEVLQSLHSQFIMVSGLSNLLLWVVLGVMCAVALNKWVLVGEGSTNGSNAA